MRVIHGDKDEKTTIVDLPFGELIPKTLFDEVQVKMKQLLSQKQHRNRKRTRTYILSGLLEFENGTKFQGSAGTRRDGNRAHYYYHPAEKLRIDAIEIEGAVFKNLRESYEDNKDLNHYLAQLEKHETSTLDALEAQMREKKKELHALTDEEAKLKEKFNALNPDDMRSESILAWPNEDIAAQKAKRIAIETELKELEQDFDYLLGNRLSPDQFKERMKDIFDRLVKADPDRQKEFLREIFTKIEVHRSNQIKLVWKLPNGCDSGGRGFAYRNKTGGWRSFIRTTFPPPEFSIIKPFCAYPVYRDADFLHQKYTLEKLSCEEIAAQISSSRTTVLKWLKLCGIRPRRSDYKDKGNSTPFGSTPKENRVIEKMKALRDKRYSYWKIAEILNAINTRTKTGKGIWHARTVQRILNDLNVI